MEPAPTDPPIQQIRIKTVARVVPRSLRIGHSIPTFLPIPTKKWLSEFTESSTGTTP